jgi:hypothetical protein
MKTIKFLSAIFSKEALITLASGINKQEYSHKVARGFASVEHNDSSITGEFIERLTAKRSLVDPLGRKYSSNYIEFRVNTFTINIALKEIEIHGDLRQVSALLTSLHECSNFTGVFEPINIDVGDWISNLEGSLNGIRIAHAVASNIEFGNSASGTLFLSVGDNESNAISRCREILSKRSHSISKAIIQFTHKARSERVAIFGNGIIKSITSDLSDLPIPIFQRALRKARPLT